MKTENNPILNSPVIGYAHHRIVLDNNKKPFDYEFIEVNATFGKLTGLDVDFIIGKTVRNVILDIEKSDFDWISVYGEIAFNLVDKELEYYSKHLGKWYHVYAYSLDKLFFTTMFVDITTTKKQTEEMQISQQRYQALVENMNDWIWEVDVDGVYTYVSPNVNEILGFSVKEVLGKTPFDFMSSNEARRVSEIFSEIVTAQKPIDKLESICIKKNGREVLFETSAKPYFNSKGELQGYRGVCRDITEHRRAGNELREERARLDYIMSITGTGIDIVDGDYNLHFVDKGWQRIYGNPDGRKCYEYFKGLNEPCSDCGIPHALATREVVVSEKVLPKEKDKIVEAHTIPFKNAEGKWLVAEFKIDITERKLAEKKIFESNNRLKIAQEVGNVGSWEHDFTTNQVTWSDHTFTIYEEDPSTFEVNFDSIISHFHPDDRENVVQDLNKSIAEKRDLRIIHRIITGKSNLRYVLEAGRIIFDDKGEVVKIVGSVADITEQKKSEKALESKSMRLEGIIEGTHVGTWEWSVQTGETVFNERWAEIIGYTLDEISPVSIETWMKFAHPDDLKGSGEQLEAHFRGEIAYYDYESRMKHKNGEWVWVLDRGKVVSWTDDGKPLLMLGTHQDITERKKAEEVLILAKQQAEEASKAKSEFLANMSHEIRTPLNGVIGFTELLKNTPLSPVQLQYVENANVSGHTLLGIINDILDFSKIEAGMLHLEMIKTDMIELLENSVDIVKFQAGKKNLELLLHIDQSMPRFAFTDPIRLKQVLANLLGNAVKFTEKGEVELKVKYKKMENGNGHISFFVCDTGIGITEEQKSKLFKSFSQADSSTTRKFGGTGLGLTISDLIVKELGGKIQVDSRYGEGSTFYFDIVTKMEEGSRLDKDEIKLIKRCLIIDDNANNRWILQDMLSNWDIECEACDNGLSALKLLETSKPFDVIICDYNMPYIDGLETIRMIREKLKLTEEKQPIILLHSSSDDAEFHKRCDELGVRFRLTKPVKSHDMHLYLCQVYEPNMKQNEEVILTVPIVQKPIAESVNILIAEDVQMNMVMIKALITKIHPEAVFHEAVNGIEVIRIMSEVLPDIIFMDVQMPELDGIETTKKIRKMEKESGAHVPIIALTAGAFKEEQERCLTAGMDEFLTKPIESEKVQAVLMKYCSRKNDKPEDTTQLIDHFCKETLLEKVGSEDFITQLLQIALSDFPQKLEKINKAIQDGSSNSIKEIAVITHQIKGAALNLCFTIFADIADSMERIASSDEGLHLLKEKYRELKCEWEILKNILEK